MPILIVFILPGTTLMVLYAKQLVLVQNASVIIHTKLMTALQTLIQVARCHASRLDVNVITLITFQCMVLRIWSVFVSILIRFMMWLRRRVKAVSANSLNPTGLVHVVVGIHNIKLFQRGGRRRRPRARLCMLRMEGLCHIVACCQEQKDLGRGLSRRWNKRASRSPSRNSKSVNLWSCGRKSRLGSWCRGL